MLYHEIRHAHVNKILAIMAPVFTPAHARLALNDTECRTTFWARMGNQAVYSEDDPISEFGRAVHDATTSAVLQIIAHGYDPQRLSVYLERQTADQPWKPTLVFLPHGREADAAEHGQPLSA